MVSDSMTNASIPMSASNSKDLPKKKRVNRSAKLKQCKLDARREQWLSQVKNKGCKRESDGIGGCNESDRSVSNLEIKPRGDINVELVHHYSDSDSPLNSPTSNTSSILGGNASGKNFTGSSGRSNSGSSGGSCSESTTGEDEEGDDECLDDWEAVADALAATNNKQEQYSPCLEPSVENESNAPLYTPPELAHQLPSEKPEEVERVPKDPPRAWKPDDACRPRCLPNLSKQLSFPMKTGRHCARGSKKINSVPSSCPICYEDLDLTDSSFLPCACGFSLCLFCHKRILEEDGRCPGCRKQYDHEPVEGEATVGVGSLTFRLARSRSMITRS